MVRLLRKKDDSSKSKLHEVLGDFELPTIPGVLTSAIDQISGGDPDLRAVAATISQDPGLLARVLGIVNSAVYAPRNPIVGAEQAVMMLGANHLESLLISIAASKAVTSQPTPSVNLREFWNTAAWRGATAAALARQFDRPRRTENFTGALLQDIAVPLLAREVPGYTTVLEHWRNGEATLSELEHARFGWTHATIARWMFEDWEFPPALADAVGEHDAPEGQAVAFPIVQMVSLLGRPSLGDRAVPTLVARIEATLGLDETEAVEVIDGARSEAARIASSIAH